jgi:hypothetical protein
VDDGARTRDSRNHNPGLYQLSYVHHRRPSETGGAPGRNRTCNRRLRRPVLYPVELRALYKSIRYSANRNLSGRCSGRKQTESEVRADYIGVSEYLKSRMGVRPFPADPASFRSNCRLVFHGALQPGERMVPLPGDCLHRAPRLVQLHGIQLP